MRQFLRCFFPVNGQLVSVRSFRRAAAERLGGGQLWLPVRTSHSDADTTNTAPSDQGSLGSRQHQLREPYSFALYSLRSTDLSNRTKGHKYCLLAHTDIALHVFESNYIIQAPAIRIECSVTGRYTLP